MLLISCLGIFVKSIEILIISSIKFIFAAPVSYLDGFDYIQTFIFTTLGGIAGVLFFYYMGEWFYNTKRNNNFIVKLRNFKRNNLSKIESRIVEKLRIKYGLLGIIILTPIFFSIPLGSILANKYYSKRKRIPLYLTISVICWSLIITTFFNFLR